MDQLLFLGWVFLVAVALGCDAFSVALSVAGPYRGQSFRIAFHFGLFQALMPVLGWGLGRGVAESIRAYDHWVAFLLLAGVGGHMIWEAFHNTEGAVTADRSRRWSLVVLSVAVSIDALAVGIALGIQRISPWMPCVLIGTVTALMSLVGLRLGRTIKSKLGKHAEAFGGAVLILLACKFLIDL